MTRRCILKVISVKFLTRILVVAPRFISKFVGGAWEKKSKVKYQQFVCKTNGCKKQVRTYCSCAPAYWLCSVCYMNHVIDAYQEDDRSI